MYESFRSSPPATRAAVIQADTPQIDTPLERIIAERSSTFMRRESRKAKNHDGDHQAGLHEAEDTRFHHIAEEDRGTGHTTPILM